MKCQDFRELIDSYLSDELLIETNLDVLRHLEECPAACRREIETRRNLLIRLRSAVKNSPQYQIREEFAESLRLKLKQNTETKKTFSISRSSWLAVAAIFLLTLGLGFWFLQTPNSSLPEVAHTNENLHLPSPEVSIANQNPPSISLENVALGDHQNCAVKYNLAEEPVEINLETAEFASLKRAVVMPLQNGNGKYELLESHICKFENHTFTHIVFRHQSKAVSVLMTDLQSYQALKDEQIIKLAASGYQLAHFDTKSQAVFVVSNLSPEENSATAGLLVNPVRQHFNNSELAKVALLTQLK